jgi:hypothetical protein
VLLSISAELLSRDQYSPMKRMCRIGEDPGARGGRRCGWATINKR